MSGLRTAAVFLTQSVVAGLAAAFVVIALKPELLTPRAQDDATAPRAAMPAVSYADAVSATAPSVVNIYTTKRASIPPSLGPSPSVRQYLENLLPAPRRRLEGSLGSGVLVSEAGYVLTNAHVVQDAEAIHVALVDGRVTQAQRVGIDPDTDLALLRIELDGLQAIGLGRSDTLRIGDVVLAIGNPFGIGQTVTQGIVSGTGRSPGLTLFENYIQTDASINPGNSGGALVNTRGELVGINTAMFSRSDGSEGIGFAIPVNLARGVMAQLIEHGRVIRGWLGINARALTLADSRSLGLGDAGGILLTGVLPNGPASRAGLRAGDIITELNDTPISTWEDALNEIARLAPGTPVHVQGWRNGSEIRLEARVVERPTPLRGS